VRRHLGAPTRPEAFIIISLGAGRPGLLEKGIRDVWNPDCHFFVFPFTHTTHTHIHTHTHTQLLQTPNILPNPILVALVWSVVSGNLALAAPIEEDTPKWTTLESILDGPAEASDLDEGAFEKRQNQPNVPEYCIPVKTTNYGDLWGPKSRYVDITPGTTHLSQLITQRS
jgi:hypothetical protein